MNQPPAQPVVHDVFRRYGVEAAVERGAGHVLLLGFVWIGTLPGVTLRADLARAEEARELARTRGLPPPRFALAANVTKWADLYDLAPDGAPPDLEPFDADERGRPYVRRPMLPGWRDDFLENVPRREAQARMAAHGCTVNRWWMPGTLERLDRWPAWLSTSGDLRALHVDLRVHAARRYVARWLCALRIASGVETLILGLKRSYHVGDGWCSPAHGPALYPDPIGGAPSFRLSATTYAPGDLETCFADLIAEHLRVGSVILDDNTPLLPSERTVEDKWSWLPRALQQRVSQVRYGALP